MTVTDLIIFYLPNYVQYTIFNHLRSFVCALFSMYSIYPFIYLIHDILRYLYYCSVLHYYLLAYLYCYVK